uniref:Uncharacterized protein n=1 Tax=Oryza brachyantha TaxID=4533 RepID=J3MBD9_ORYBR
MLASSAAFTDRPAARRVYGDGDGGNRAIVPLFLAAAFLFFVIYQLFGVAAAAVVMALFCAFALAANNVKVKAAFLRVSRAKLLVAKYCDELMIAGPVYHVAGLGFGVSSQVFPRWSPLLADISQAILRVFENGTIQRLETAMVSAYNCTAAAADGALHRLRPENYWGLFLMTLFASTASLAVYGVLFHHGTTCAGGHGAVAGCHRKQGEHVHEAPSSTSGSVGHGRKDTEMVAINMECELTACIPQQK